MQPVQKWVLHSFFFIVACFDVAVQVWPFPWATAMRDAENKFSISTGILAGREGSFTGWLGNMLVHKGLQSRNNLFVGAMDVRTGFTVWYIVLLWVVGGRQPVRPCCGPVLGWAGLRGEMRLGLCSPGERHSRLETWSRRAARSQSYGWERTPPQRQFIGLRSSL